MLHALEDLLVEPLFKIFYTFACKKVREITITDKYMENLKQASGEIYAQEPSVNFFFSTILSFVALVYNSYFFQNSRFTEIIWL